MSVQGHVKRHEGGFRFLPPWHLIAINTRAVMVSCMKHCTTFYVYSSMVYGAGMAACAAVFPCLRLLSWFACQRLPRHTRLTRTNSSSRVGVLSYWHTITPNSGEAESRYSTSFTLSVRHMFCLSGHASVPALLFLRRSGPDKSRKPWGERPRPRPVSYTGIYSALRCSSGGRKRRGVRVQYLST